jgi:hypothetical protein
VIPTVFLAGALIGRWWFVPTAGLVWVVLLVSVNDLGLSAAPFAAGFAMANAAVGVAVHKTIVLALRHVRGTSG